MANLGPSRLLAVLTVAAGAVILESTALAQDLPETPATNTAAAARAAPESFTSKHIRVFRDYRWYEPLRAEPHEGKIQLLIPAWAKEFPHSVEPGTRFSWQITLGRELPILAVSPQISNNGGEIDPKEKWGIGLWTPVHFHVIEDFKDPSAPIVDTDYRFGAMVKFQYAFSDTRRLGIRYVPWAHESTHLGDEYTIVAPTVDPDFERVNVSYEYQEYGFSLEFRELLGNDDHWIFRHGGIIPWGSDGYYSDHLLDSDEATLTPSKKNYEPSFGFEYVMPEWRDRQTYISFDLRDKLIYNYHQTPDNPEKRQWSFNLQVGRTAQMNENRALKDYFIQFYRGVNPYGQLRSQKDWWSIGFGWTFGI
jgi:hypothetical protein